MFCVVVKLMPWFSNVNPETAKEGIASTAALHRDSLSLPKDPEPQTREPALQPTLRGCNTVLRFGLDNFKAQSVAADNHLSGVIALQLALQFDVIHLKVEMSDY